MGLHSRKCARRCDTGHKTFDNLCVLLFVCGERRLLERIKSRISFCQCQSVGRKIGFGIQGRCYSVRPMRGAASKGFVRNCTVTFKFASCFWVFEIFRIFNSDFDSFGLIVVVKVLVPTGTLPSAKFLL